MERRMKISPKLLIIIAVILAIAIGITAWLNSSGQSTGDLDGSTLTVLVNGEEKISYSMKDLMSMDEATVYAELQSSKDGDEKGNFTGVTLKRLLKTAGVKKCETVVLTAGDGYSSAANASETGNVLIAYEKDGSTLGYYTKGGAGPLRCIFTEDTYGNRSVKYLVKVDCRSK